jgi:hypothetical protein
VVLAELNTGCGWWVDPENEFRMTVLGMLAELKAALSDPADCDPWAALRAG